MESQEKIVFSNFTRYSEKGSVDSLWRGTRSPFQYPCYLSFSLSFSYVKDCTTLDRLQLASKLSLQLMYICGQKCAKLTLHNFQNLCDLYYKMLTQPLLSTKFVEEKSFQFARKRLKIPVVLCLWKVGFWKLFCRWTVYTIILVVSRIYLKRLICCSNSAMNQQIVSLLIMIVILFPSVQSITDATLRGTFNATLNNPVSLSYDDSMELRSPSKQAFLLGV